MLVCVGDFERNKHTIAGAAGCCGYTSLAPLASRQEGNLSLPWGGVGWGSVWGTGGIKTSTMATPSIMEIFENKKVWGKKLGDKNAEAYSRVKPLSKRRGFSPSL